MFSDVSGEAPLFLKSSFLVLTSVCFCLVLLSSVGSANTNPSFDWNSLVAGESSTSELELISFAELESSMRSGTLSREDLKKTARVLAQKYLENNRPQEAVWALSYGGLHGAAVQGHLYLQETLLRGKLETIDDGLGLEELSLVQVGESGFAGRLTWASDRSDTGHRGENIFLAALAYYVDSILGGGLVPMTVLRFLPEIWETVAIEVAVGEAQPGVQPSTGHRGMPAAEVTQRNRMWLIDYLMGGLERGGRPDLWRQGDRLVARGYENAMGRVRYRGLDFRGVEYGLHSDKIQTPAVLQALRNMNRRDFDAFAESVRDAGGEPDRLIRRVLAQRDALLAAVDAARAHRGRRCSKSLSGRSP